MAETPKVAFPPGLIFVVGVFPKVSERFIFREIQSVSSQGLGTLVFTQELGRRETLYGVGSFQPLVRVPRGIRLVLGMGATCWSKPSFRLLQSMLRAWKDEPGLRTTWRLFRGSVRGGWIAGCLDHLQGGDIHGHFMNHPSTMAWTASLFSSRRCSLSGHAWDVFVGPEFLREKLRACGPIIACSREVGGFLATYCADRKKIRLVHHGIPLDRWRYRREEPAAPFRLLWIGRFVEKKNPFLFLDLCEALHGKDPERPWTAVMVGAGPLFGEVSQAVRDRELEQRLLLVGQKEEKQVKELLEGAHLLVLTSLQTSSGDREGIPNVILEAGAVGVPVVSTETGSVGEVIIAGETGLLVPEKDLDALTEAVILLLRDTDQRRKLSHSMRRKVETSFDAEKQGGLWAEVIVGGEARPELKGRSPRVAFVLEATEGGTARHVSSVLPVLAERGLDVHLVCSVGRDPGFKRCILELREKGLPIWEVPMCREIRPWRDLVSLIRLVRLFKAKRFELVHTHSSKAGILGRLAAALCPVPWVLHTPHAYAFLGANRWLSRRGMIAAEQLLGGLSDGILAVGREEAEQTVRNRICRQSEVAIARNGLDPDRVPPKRSPDDLREELGLHPNKLTVGGVGRLSRQKSPMDFLEAAAMVRRQLTDIQFVWFGDGVLRDAMERRVWELGLKDCVCLAGHQVPMELWYPAMDLLCHTAAWEGLPYVLLEAMLQKVPVVAYAIPGVREMIRDGVNGWVVPHRDVDALAGRVVELLRSPALRDAMGEDARKTVVEAYRLETQVDQIINVYAKLIEGIPVGEGEVQ